MPIFETPEPVRVVLDVVLASVRLRAEERADSLVEVRPHNPAKNKDVELAERTTVELAGGRLTVRSERSRWRNRLIGPGHERVDIEIAVPAGSALELRGYSDIVCEGTLGDVDIDTGLGDVQLDRAGAARVKTSMGDIRLASAAGPVELHTSMGTVRVGRAAGEVTARTSAGDIRVEDGDGDLQLSTSAGDVQVERAGGRVSAKTSAGDVRIRSVRSGSVTATTSYGQLEIGVARGTAAWLDVQARHGVVRSELEAADGPGDSELTVEIHATTGYGDIVLRRA